MPARTSWGRYFSGTAKATYKGLHAIDDRQCGVIDLHGAAGKDQPGADDAVERRPHRGVAELQAGQTGARRHRPWRVASAAAASVVRISPTFSSETKPLAFRAMVRSTSARALASLCLVAAPVGLGLAQTCLIVGRIESQQDFAGLDVLALNERD